MSECINYTRASTYYLIGNLFNRGISFITVPIFTRILSTSDYGIVNTFSSWTNIIGMIMGFALYMGIRAAFVDYREEVNGVLSTVATFTLIVYISTTGIAMLGVNLLQVDVNLTLLLLCFSAGFSNAIIADYSMYLMMSYRYKARTVLLVLPNLISTIISVIAITVVLNDSLYMGQIVPAVAINFIFCVIIFFVIFFKKRPGINKSQLKYVLNISAPLILHGIALNILSQSDRTMITAFAGASQTGIYSLVFNFSMIASVIISSLEGIWVPWFTQKMMERNIPEINKMVKDYVNLITYLMVGLLLIAPEILKLLASKPYWEGISIIPPIVLSNFMIFLYTLYVNIEHYYKKTKYISFNTIVAAVIDLVLNFIFVPKYGYVAAAYTMLFSYSLSFVLHSSYAKKLEPEVYPLKTFSRPLVHIAVTIVLFYALGNYAVLRWVLAFTYAGLMFVRERKRIGEFFPELSKRYKFFCSLNYS